MAAVGHFHSLSCPLSARHGARFWNDESVTEARPPSSCVLLMGTGSLVFILKSPTQLGGVMAQGTDACRALGASRCSLVLTVRCSECKDS